jgi:hypothetical protein
MNLKQPKNRYHRLIQGNSTWVKQKDQDTRDQTTELKIKNSSVRKLSIILILLKLLTFSSSQLSSVGRAFDCSGERYQMVPGSIPGVEIFAFFCSIRAFVLPTTVLGFFWGREKL